MDISKDVPPERSFGARRPPPLPPSTSTTHVAVSTRFWFCLLTVICFRLVVFVACFPFCGCTFLISLESDQYACSTNWHCTFAPHSHP
eukprot:1940657-Amphidinium_carterae.1